MDKAYPVGTKVLINTFMRMPDGWNGHMFDELMGQTATIISAPSYIADPRSYNYKLDKWQWAWRHLDLTPVHGVEPEPNLAFRIKKHAR